jgi:hypothetical protein
MVTVVPVPQPVVRDPEGDGLVVALAQLRQQLRVHGPALARASSTRRWASHRISMTSAARTAGCPAPVW